SFHPLGGDALPYLAQKLDERSIARVFGGQSLRASSDSLGNRKLTRRENLHGADFYFWNSTQVSDGELPNIANLIAPKFHTHGIIQGRGENIDYAATHREFTALGHHVHA